MFIQRPPERLLNHGHLGIKHLLDARLFGISRDLVLHLDIIRRLQTSLLAQSLHTVNNLASETLLGQAGVDLRVQDGEHVVIGVGLEVLGRVVLLETALDDQVAGLEGDAVDNELAGLDVTLDFVGSDGGKSLLDATHVLLELFAENGPVGGDRVLHAVLGFVRGEHEVAHVELLGDVALERLDVGQVLLVVVDDDEGLEGLLETDGALLARVAGQLDDLLHALYAALDVGVVELLADLGEGKEMHGAGVLCLEILGDVREELEVDGIGEEGGEGGEATAEGEEDLKEGVESVEGIVETVLALETLAVEADVPVGGVVDELEEAGDDSVKAVT